MEKNVRVIIAGGGTGGHIFPAVAIGHALQRLQPGTELLYVGAKGKMEMEKVPQEGFKIIGLDIAGFNRSHLYKNLLLPFKVLKSMLKARNILKDFKPDMVIGVGGYASFPMLNAAQAKGIPTLIQEQNSFAGKSNKILAKKADAICVAYEHMERFFPKDKILISGNPVREKIAQSKVSKSEGIKWSGLNEQKITVLIIGGSLGAKSINEAIDGGLEEIINNDIQLIWQTGTPYYKTALERAKKFEDKVTVYEFIKDMDYAYAAADMVVSRAGALAISELCIVAKPVIFVPYPYAAEDHQTSNAMSLVQHNAALMVKDSDAGSELVKKMIALVSDKHMQSLMSKNLHNAAIKNADERIAKKAFEIIKRRRA